MLVFKASVKELGPDQEHNEDSLTHYELVSILEETGRYLRAQSYFPIECLH